MKAPRKLWNPSIPAAFGKISGFIYINIYYPWVNLVSDVSSHLYYWSWLQETKRRGSIYVIKQITDKNFYNFHSVFIWFFFMLCIKRKKVLTIILHCTRNKEKMPIRAGQLTDMKQKKRERDNRKADIQKKRDNSYIKK